MSASSRLTAATIASRYGRRIVGPTWTSLIWAIEKPCSAGGRSATGTSMRTTAAVRRALTNPPSVTRPAASGTEREITKKSEHEQRREQAHADESAPGEQPVDRSRRPGAPCPEREWQGQD